MLKFYSAAEKCAVEQVAARAAHGGYGWSSLQILNPSRYIKVNLDAVSPFALRTPGQASFERASVPETFLEFRHLLKNFPRTNLKMLNLVKKLMLIFLKRETLFQLLVYLKGKDLPAI